MENKLKSSSFSGVNFIPNKNKLRAKTHKDKEEENKIINEIDELLDYEIEKVN